MLRMQTMCTTNSNESANSRLEATEEYKLTICEGLKVVELVGSLREMDE